MRKGPLFPVARMKLLNLLANPLIGERPQVVIKSLAKLEEIALRRLSIPVVFQAEIIDNFL